MKIKIELSPDDVTQALSEYLERRGFAYVDHEFRDGIVDVSAEPAPPAPPKAVQPPNTTQPLPGSVPTNENPYPATEEVVYVAPPARGARTNKTDAVKEWQAPTLASLLEGPSTLFSDDDNDASETRSTPFRPLQGSVSSGAVVSTEEEISRILRDNLDYEKASQAKKRS